MRTYLSLIIITLCFITFKTKAQCTTPITYSIQVTPETCDGCCDGSAQIMDLSGGCPAYMCVWNQGGPNINPVNGLCTGTYTLTIYDFGCCPPVSQTCFIAQGGTTTNLKQLNTDNVFRIFPSPVNSVLNIIDKQNQFQNATIDVINYMGQKVMSIPFNQQINVSSLQSGFYTIKIKNERDLIFTAKFIKQE